MYKALPKLVIPILCAILGLSHFSAAQTGLPANSNASAAITEKFESYSKHPQRFLGWHYAAAARQDTTRWVRQNKPPLRRELADRGKNAHPRIAGSSAPAPGFETALTLPTGSIPTTAVQGDFNEDGNVDLAVCNGGDNTIYVLLGNGDGTFAVPEVLYTSGQSPVWLATAKLKGGGHLDLITVDGDSGGVEVFFGNGDGTFQPSTTVTTMSQTPTYVITGDFNNDGNADIAVGLTISPGWEQPQFMVLFGDGTGSFPGTLAPPPVYNGGDDPLPTDSLVSGDVNHDGTPDIVATVAFGGSITYLNQQGLQFQQGYGFGPSDGEAPVAVALADVDGDGCLDALETGSYGLLTIGKGTCDGHFIQGALVCCPGNT